MLVGNIIGANPVTPKTFILQAENGQEVLGVMVDEEKIFTATTNDIREGKVAAVEGGVVTGEKVIPSYHTHEGYWVIPSGSEFIIPLSLVNAYDFTKLQVIICPYSGSIANSVSAEKIAINDKVYSVNSSEQIASVTKDHDTKSFNLGITNDRDNLYIVRYFTYKEIY